MLAPNLENAKSDFYETVKGEYVAYPHGLGKEYAWLYSEFPDDYENMLDHGSSDHLVTQVPYSFYIEDIPKKRLRKPGTRKERITKFLKYHRKLDTKTLEQQARDNEEILAVSLDAYAQNMRKHARHSNAVLKKNGELLLLDPELFKSARYNYDALESLRTISESRLLEQIAKETICLSELAMEDRRPTYYMEVAPYEKNRSHFVNLYKSLPTQFAHCINANAKVRALGARAKHFSQIQSRLAAYRSERADMVQNLIQANDEIVDKSHAQALELAWWASEDLRNFRHSISNLPEKPPMWYPFGQNIKKEKLARIKAVEQFLFDNQAITGYTTRARLLSK